MKPCEIFEWHGGDQILSQIRHQKDIRFKFTRKFDEIGPFNKTKLCR